MMDPTKAREPATKGDVAQLALHLRMVAISLSNTLTLLSEAGIARAEEELLDLAEAVDGLALFSDELRRG